MTAGAWSHRLHELATEGTGGFLLAYVLIPAVAGILARFLLGDRRMQRIQPAIKIVNTAALVLLCYMNAAVSLPQIVARPDLNFLAVVLLVTVFLCIVMFGAGWLLSRLLRLDPARQAPLIFGLGMNNNGTGLVVAGGALADFPLALLPILLYNLVQHLAAGLADRLLFFKANPPETAASCGR
jgi:BASS family bile acid:Na+ symporter